MSRLSEAIQTLPHQSWIPILALVIIGLALWLAGGRLLRAAFAALGLVAGAGAGWMVGSTIDFGVPVWVIALIAALLVACIATLAFRATVAVALGAVLALAAPLGVFTAAGARLAPATEEPGQPADSEPPLVAAMDEPEIELDEIDLWLREIAGGGVDLLTDPSGTGVLADPRAAFDLQQEVRDRFEHAAGVATELSAQAGHLWKRTPAELRDRLVGASVVGALIGFLFGTLATTISTWFVTAFAGSLTWLVGAWSAASKAGVSEGSWVPQTPNAWLTWWVVISVIGLLIQWTTRPKRADKPA